MSKAVISPKLLHTVRTVVPYVPGKSHRRHTVRLYKIADRRHAVIGTGTVMPSLERAELERTYRNSFTHYGSNYLFGTHPESNKSVGQKAGSYPGNIGVG